VRSVKTYFYRLHARNLAAILALMGEADTSHGARLTKYLEQEWAARNTTRGAWCRSVGLAGSTVLRWSQGVEPDLRNLQVVAEGLNRRLVDVLFAAGYIDESDVRVRTVAPPRMRTDVKAAIKADPTLSDPEREALLAVHNAFQTLASTRRRTRRPPASRSTNGR
jgi:hypothetical protein